MANSNNFKDFKGNVPQKELMEIIQNGPYPIRFPAMKDLDQDEEWCEAYIDDHWHKIRFHDYSDVFNIPGLYETIFYRTLMCDSPNRIANLLKEVCIELQISPTDLKVLDFGAGNGMAGEALQTIGTRNIVGVDILPEAKKANWRDRPWVYDDYLVCDLTNLTPDQNGVLSEYGFNALCIVAALGYGDIPVEAFKTAFGFVEKGGFLAFNIKADFLRPDNENGFSKLINQMINDGRLEIQLYKKYRHRININGDPLYYIAIVAIKG